MTIESDSNQAEGLRQAAEERLREENITCAEQIESMSAEDLRRLIQELRVHQIELKIQNETLRHTQAELEKMQHRYRELYDNAPVGYISVDTEGIVLTANRPAAALLDIKRKDMIGRGFSRFITPADRDIYSQFLRPLHHSKDHDWTEVRLLRTDGHAFYTRLEGHTISRGKDESPEILLCLSDVSEKKETESVLEKTRDQMRALARHLQDVREEERTSIAREIHDEMGQVMAYLKMQLSAIEERIPESDTRARQRLSSMKDALVQSIHSTKNLVSRLRPYQLDELGLVAAIESYIREFQERSGIEIHFHARNQEPAIGRDKETAVYRIVQEALSNVARHSGANYTVIDISSNPGEILLEISDDGSGFDLQGGNARFSYGLVGMRERAIAVGGELEIQSNAGRGTRIKTRIPI